MDWAVVIATFVGPIVAVGITLWHQDRDRAYQRRLAVFTTMMRLRRHQMAGEYVGALNLVPVEFHRVPAVVQRYKDLMNTLSDPGWQGAPEAIRRLNEQTETRSTELMAAMATSLSIRLEQMDILRGAYAPQGWLDDEALGQATRRKVLDVLSGQQPLTVQLQPTPPPPPPYAPEAQEGWGAVAALFERKP